MVHRGRWSLLGGMWTEPDCNLTAGESLVRQGLFAQSYFLEHFGKVSEVAWLPDSFGFTGALPQILKGLRIRYFYTAKLHMQDYEPFPHSLFWWEGIDGTRVLAYSGAGKDGYNATATVSSVVDSWVQHHARSDIPTCFQPLGYTGEAGPSDEDIESAKCLSQIPMLPRACFQTPEEYFRSCETWAGANSSPVWKGELYLQRHRGTYTTQGRTKCFHRRAEQQLLTAEVMQSLSCFAGLAHSSSFQSEWEKLLECETHDVLAGTSIHSVHEDAVSDLRAVGKKSYRSSLDAASMLADHLTGGRPEGDAVLVLNPRISHRPIRVRLPNPLPGAQRSGHHYLVTTSSCVPGLGAVTLQKAESSSAGILEPASVAFNNSEVVLQSSHLVVRVDAHGHLTEFRSKTGGPSVEAQAPGALVVYDDRPAFWDAWELDSSYTTRPLETVRLERRDIVEEGPHRASIRLEFGFRASKIIQYIRLWRNAPALEFDTIVDWHERRCLLRSEFVPSSPPSKVVSECAFGVVERHLDKENSVDVASFEFPGHRFAALETDRGDGGLAIVTDSKYGYGVKDGSIGVSLLRSPVFPDPVADEGQQRMRYEVYPYSESWVDSDVLAEADALNADFICVPCRPVDLVWNPVRFSGARVGFGALKRAQTGDGIIARLYEPYGQHGNLSVSLPPAWRVCDEVNLLEERVGEPELSFRPFEIHSWRIAM